MALTRKELKSVHNNVMTVMENRIMAMVGCDRKTANLVANEVLDLDREAEDILNDNKEGREADSESFEKIVKNNSWILHK